MAFNCTKCGACCRRAFLMPGFPFPVNPDGACSKLVDNQCSIYETRPAICRHGHSREVMGLSADEYDRLTANLCNRMQAADGIDESYRVKSG